MALYDCPDDDAVTSALESLAPGDILDLYPGTVYSPFEVPSIANGDSVTIRAKNTSFSAGTRVTAAVTLPIIEMTDANQPGPHMVGTGSLVWQGIELRSVYTASPGNRALLTFGNNDTNPSSVADLPANCAMRWCRLSGSATFQRFGVVVDTQGQSLIHDSIIDNINMTGSQAYGISGTSHTGSIDIYNCLLQRCGSGVLFGGTDPPLVLPSSTLHPRITIERCHFYWPTNWAGASELNHIELKRWLHPRIVGNVFENYWPVAQANVINLSDYSGWEGWDIPSKGAVIAFNKFLHCPERVITQGDAPIGGLPRRARGLVVVHNFGLVGRNPKDGTGSTNPMLSFYAQQGGVRCERNTFVADQNITMHSSIVFGEVGLCRGLRLNGNILPGASTGNGIFVTAQGDGGGWGEAAMNALAGVGNWQCTGNAVGGTDPGGSAEWPAGNVGTTDNAAIAAALTATYRIDPNGPLAAYVGVLGADMDLVEAATDGVTTGVVGTTRVTFDDAAAGFSG